ncbi:MAG: asparagine synthase (glutamine-hydrolyzing) [Christensenellaceae bacterium]|jgi:asparagine synthase (glutamine-hydrolysing)|nr:asparagine synthase (glutamine-hydrolyzing) [Christensenellaceae bacterium]
MCGIAGITSKTKAKIGRKHELMKLSLKDRGPNQDGICAEGKTAFVHTRLSVVDIEGGKQPMQLVWGGRHYTMVYNGELYNTAEIKAQLLNLGHKFEGHSDTEVLLHSYVEWGDKCPQQLNGIFAFAVYCFELDKLFFARDRIGVKPFFYTVKEGEFIFASEIKALFAAGIKPQMDKNSVANIVMLGPGRVQGSGVFAGIKELKPAECGYFKNGKLNIFSYWGLKDKKHMDSFDDTVFNVRTLVIDAIKRQLVGDVRVGTFLSGGLDSSIISSVASKHFDEPLHTFSVDYKDNDRYFVASKFQPNKDSDYIDIMNEYIGGVSHKTGLETKQLASAIFNAADARDLPGMADIDSSLLLFCQEIKKHVTVALSGECADEIFGGYPWFTDSEIKSRYGFPWAQNTTERFELLNNHWRGKIDGEHFVNELYEATIKSADVLSDATPNERRTKEMAMLNFNWFMQTLLDRKDRMSMYNGLEVRVPFCDHRIAEYLYSVPWEYKYHNNTEKGLLRQALSDHLPPTILQRKKSPYPKTHNPEYLSLMKERLQKILDDPSARLFDIIDKEALQKLMSAKDFKFYGQLMNVPQTFAYFVQLEYLLKKHDVEIIY